jgi:hypothetical protein
MARISWLFSLFFPELVQTTWSAVQDPHADESAGGPVAASLVRVSYPDHLKGTQHIAKEFRTDIAISCNHKHGEPPPDTSDG